jgi:hypothetical protein
VTVTVTVIMIAHLAIHELAVMTTVTTTAKGGTERRRESVCTDVVLIQVRTMDSPTAMIGLLAQDVVVRKKKMTTLGAIREIPRYVFLTRSVSPFLSVIIRY